MLRVLGRVSFVMVLTLALGGAVVIGVLLSLVGIFITPSFSTSLATVQNVSAEAWLIFDLETGHNLYSYHGDKTLPIASITKLPAAITFYNTDNVWATTTVSWADVVEDGRAGKLYVGETYMYHTLLYPLLLESSNDAAHVFGRSDPNLVNSMNSYASSLGLVNTSFTDPSGLSDKNVSSPNDVKVMLRNIYYSNRHLIDITTLREYYSLDKGWLNNNPFVNDLDYLGGKHGYTYAANRTAAAIFNETLKNGTKRPIGYVLLSSSNLEYDMSLLRDHVQHNVSFQ